jgi:hypothetical protein
MSLLAAGYRVEARLEGLFERPRTTIHGYRPDVWAFNGAQIVIVEVVKGDIDWPKLAAFEQYAAEHQDVRLQLVNVE